MSFGVCVCVCVCVSIYIYIYIYKINKLLKNWENLSNPSYPSFFHLCRSRLCLFISKQKWSKANPKARELKRNYLGRNQAYKRNIEECKPLHLKVKNIKDLNRANARKMNIFSALFAAQTKNILTLYYSLSKQT